MAKKTLLDALKPLLMVHASPTKQSCSFTPSTTDEPYVMMLFSHITSVPIYTLASVELTIVQSLSLDAPFISHSSCIIVFVMSVVFTIFTLLPMVPRSLREYSISSRMSRLSVSRMVFSSLCFTMNAARGAVSPLKMTRFPSPASFNTDTKLSSPKVAPSEVSILPTPLIRQLSPMEYSLM